MLHWEIKVAVAIIWDITYSDQAIRVKMEVYSLTWGRG